MADFDMNPPERFWHWARAIANGLEGEDGTYHGDDLLEIADGNIGSVVLSVAKKLVRDNGYSYSDARAVFKLAQSILLCRALGVEEPSEDRPEEV